MKKLSVFVLGTVFCGMILASSTVNAKKEVNLPAKEVQKDDALYCRITDGSGGSKTCWLCKCSMN